LEPPVFIEEYGHQRYDTHRYGQEQEEKVFSAIELIGTHALCIGAYIKGEFDAQEGAYRCKQHPD
jgi:hypothetical protein